MCNSVRVKRNGTKKAKQRYPLLLAEPRHLLIIVHYGVFRTLLVNKFTVKIPFFDSIRFLAAILHKDKRILHMFFTCSWRISSPLSRKLMTEELSGAPTPQLPCEVLVSRHEMHQNMVVFWNTEFDTVTFLMDGDHCVSN
ncbi:hypothetical protein KIN20_014707 [Parelaphostrongylus tenuis]|uniref:Uncharacterized protein n=1 Tax=Parelaphostrongylus tenuis TaxID=148309 RepID=A0AAD5MIN4_PARTN|nr:hypothetical protein KIN20_014707 [Parelaphostrongylus tenuis]